MPPQLALLDWTRPERPTLALAPPPQGIEPWQGVTPRAWQREALPLALACIDAGQRGIVSAIMGAGKSIYLVELARCRPAPAGSVVVILTPSVKLVEQLAATASARLGAGMVGRYYTHAKEIAPVIVCCNASAVALAAELAARGLSVSLAISDECHKSSCDSMVSAFGMLNPAAAIGMTATPFRALNSEDLSLWPTMLYEYGAKAAFADGVVVPPSLMLWDGAESPLDDVCVTLTRRALAKGGGAHFPGVANATSILDAREFAAVLNRAGIAADVIHSQQRPGVGAANIEALRTGALSVLVHVNMLSEGIDLPWLRWLCMRRAVGSRVRFCQEVGRVLRSSPGLLPAKTCAYLLDPNDLFDTFGLTYEAMLAGSAAEKQAASELDALAADVINTADNLDGKRLQQDMPERWASRLDAARRYVRHLFVAMLAAGVVEQKIKTTGWRRYQPSEKQLDALGWALGKMLADTAVPLVHRKALAFVRENAASLQKGDVSDLMTIGLAVKDRLKAKHGWPQLEESADDDSNR